MSKDDKTKKIITEREKIKETLTRGVKEVVQEDSLRKRLESGKQLRVKFGIDPTGANIHIGHAIVFLKLRDFQELGHLVVLIIGDATGVIGDTSDKESERSMLTRENLKENEKTYLDQIGKLLDIKSVEVRHNSEWLDGLAYNEIGEQANLFSVADFTARENIKRRLLAGTRVSLREVLYPLMQGYDSVSVESDVELGGIDQRFNLLAGRTLQKHYSQEPQDILMTDLLEGLDGRKMSKSFENAIYITDDAKDMYGKIMRVNDGLMLKYYMLCTRVPMEEIERLQNQLESGENPRNIKMKLASEIVTLYHGHDTAQQAEKYFVQAFQKKSVPEDVQSTQTSKGTLLAEILVQEGIVSSKSAFKRLIEEGAVKNTDTEESVVDSEFTIYADATFKIGKRRFITIKIV